ncbi:MAG: aminobenzoyl-glutamate transporter [Legionellales bacterium]|nr:aminobenzoyl-glutamate transporter [Legionellales bacterium]|tara:strand:+ start:1426 stop:2910 length:1485 start_codon:yes stop_codon:yes gene_type:complete
MKLLSFIIRTGNKLPDPTTIFFMGIITIIVLSTIIANLGWSVVDPKGNTIVPFSLISSEGAWWFLSTAVENFISFPPLGIVLVGMLGIGLAEKTGFLPALLHFSITHVHHRLLTPATMLLGIISSVALDAGYVVLIPIAAALYIAAGRSPLTGIAVSFAGVSAGFSANLFITALDPLLAGFTQASAQIIDAKYQVAITGNWWFMIISTIVLTFVGWFVTERFVEPAIEGVADQNLDDNYDVLNKTEKRALLYSVLSAFILLIALFFAITSTSGPLFGIGKRFDRWIEATVPLLFILFFIPGLIYGTLAGKIKNDRDVANMLGEVMARLGPYIVLAFFAAQFIAAFNQSGLGQMLAVAGGQFLRQLMVQNELLLSCFVLMVVMINLVIGSSSAKYAFFAPVFVPMLMQVGISPELTQAAYRVGDSVSNIITPMNPYMIIIIVEVRKYARGSGLGTVVAMMLPYSITFLIIWLILLFVWINTGLPLGPGGNLYYKF